MKIKLIISMFLMAFLCHTSGAKTVFIFNPEAKVTRLGKVRTTLEHTLKSRGIDAEVYLFASSKDFTDSVRRFDADVAIVPSYYHTLMRNTYEWKVILSGHYEGSKVFNKILITPKSLTKPAQLLNKSLATVSLGASSLPYIQRQLPEGLSIEDIRVVSVSKDIDAIMALGFEQVDAAIVTIKSFETLKTINFNAVQDMHILKELNPIEYPKIVAFPHCERIEKFTDAFENMTYEGSGLVVLEFFGVTGFDRE
ncbi:PhnD/SsuA/transferrin family substrate-binding protein [Desulfonema magnum]|uniref:ABC transporter substrate-binding protein n=1 Tax=Desulfonema magnum TaxID=45655 RepID=A0A975BKZ7_9BACT|nr:PhnD/SsuA/transferrin family substrate-binding protein [Desulfonema magnum]QTA87212.1 Uncharacterized protein dnm_032420 [Desulfonema magnum]